MLSLIMRQIVARIAEMVERGPVTATTTPVEPAMVLRNTAGRISLILLLMMSGCASIGPATVPRDRGDYIKAIGNSWKEQTLLNVVRMRYGDAPNFLEISSIISSYAFQGQFAAGTQLSSNLTPLNPFNLTTLGASATYLDRPTITYAPLAGDKFAKSLLQPLPSNAVFALIQAGYPADYILQMTVHSINGIHSRSSIDGYARPAHADFFPLLDAVRRLQLAGAVNLSLEKKDGPEIGTLIFSSTDNPQVRNDVEYIEKTLRVKPRKKGQISVVVGDYPNKSDEIAVMSRSLVEILLEASKSPKRMSRLAKPPPLPGLRAQSMRMIARPSTSCPAGQSRKNPLLPCAMRTCGTGSAIRTWRQSARSAAMASERHKPARRGR